jgi:dienelactone hydrolase
MKTMKTRTKKKLKMILISVAVLLVLGLGAMAVYVSDFSRAGEEAVTVMADSSLTVTEYDGFAAFGNTESETGFIFYPGGKVEYTAYAPLIQEVAQGDIFCVIPEMPFNLAVFDSKAAKEMMKQFPDIQNWYIGGHSLGGAMAADYAGRNPDQFKGLILLAAYSASDISDTGLRVLSIYGSEDGVLNREKYKECFGFLPADCTELSIEGGNHAQFGDYGLQDGDNAATITPEEQWRITSEEILRFINGTLE